MVPDTEGRVVPRFYMSWSRVTGILRDMSDTPGDDKPTCFMAMPISMTPEHTTRYGDPKHWLHVMEELFEPAIRAAGFEPVKPVSTGAYMIHSQIVTNLEKADLVLCDLSAHNPNVFFELGVRTSLNLPIALVGEQDMKLPFDTSGINTHIYSPALHVWDLPGETEKLTRHPEESALSCKGKNPLWQQFGLTKRAQEAEVSESPTEAAMDLRLSHMGDLMAGMQVMSSQMRELFARSTASHDETSQSHFNIAKRRQGRVSALQDALAVHGPQFEGDPGKAIEGFLALGSVIDAEYNRNGIITIAVSGGNMLETLNELQLEASRHPGLQVMVQLVDSDDPRPRPLNKM